MSQPNLKKNYIYRLVYDALILIIPFITTPYVSRVLGVQGVGTYSFIYSIVSYFLLFAALGTVTYGTREIAQHRDNKKEASKIFWEIELMTIATSFIMICAFMVLVLLSDNSKYYLLAMSPFLFATMFDISWFYTGYEKIKLICSVNLASRIVGIVLLFTIVKSKDDLIVYMVINSCVQLLGSLGMWLFLPRMLVKVDWRSFRFKNHLKETLVYFIPTIATSIYAMLDKTLIGLITNNRYQNGYYEQASKIIIMAQTLVFVSLNAVMSARLSYLFAKDRVDEIKERIEKAINYVLLIGVGCIFGLYGVIRYFVPLFFGDKFFGVVDILYIMLPLIIITGISYCLGSLYYIPSGRRRQSTKYIITGAVANLVLNLILIPFFKAIGATVASVLSEIIITVLYLAFCNSFLKVKTIGKHLYKRVFAGVIMFGIVFAMGLLIKVDYLYLVIMQVIVGVAVYFGILLLLKDELLKELINKAIDTVFRRNK